MSLDDGNAFYAIVKGAVREHVAIESYDVISAATATGMPTLQTV